MKHPLVYYFALLSWVVAIPLFEYFGLLMYSIWFVEDPSALSRTGHTLSDFVTFVMAGPDRILFAIVLAILGSTFGLVNARGILGAYQRITESRESQGDLE